MHSLVVRVRRAWRVVAAFLFMGASEQFAYPLGIITQAIGWVVAPMSLYFISKLVPSQSSVGDDYFTFAVIGVLATTAANAGLQAFGGILDVTISAGRLETLLVEPIRWRLIPFGLSAWPVLLNAGVLLFQFGLAFALGAHFLLSGLFPTAVILLGAAATGHAIGVFAASVKILSKRSDPFLTIYGIMVGLLSGTVFPVNLLPVPLRVVSYVLPQTYVLTAIRRVLMPGGESIAGPSALQASLMLVGFLVVVYPLGIWLFGRALEAGRRVGTLAGY
jgi:ABC-2 type transport system permease protein